MWSTLLFAATITAAAESAGSRKVLPLSLLPVQSFYQFLFGGFARPVTGYIYQGVQRMYPEHQIPQVLLALILSVKRMLS